MKSCACTLANSLGRSIIESAEKFGFENLASSTNYRSNQRVVISSKSACSKHYRSTNAKMSDAIWERIKDEIKPISLVEGDYKQTV